MTERAESRALHRSPRSDGARRAAAAAVASRGGGDKQQADRPADELAAGRRAGYRASAGFQYSL